MKEVTTGHIGITSGSLIKPGKYPSKLDWSLPGDGIGFIYVQGMRTDQAMLPLSSNGERGAGLRGTATNGKRCAYQGHKAEMKEEKPSTAARAKGYDVIDKR